MAPHNAVNLIPLSDDARLYGLDSRIRYPADMTPERAQQEFPRIDKQIRDNQLHFTRDLPEVHKRSLPAAHSIGVGAGVRGVPAGEQRAVHEGGAAV